MITNPGMDVPITIIPTSPINLTPTQSIAGVRIQQLKVDIQQPVRPPVPINVQKRLTGAGVRSVSIQYLSNPFDSSSTGVSISTQSIAGTNVLRSSSSGGPIKFSIASSTAPTNVGIQTNTATGTTSGDFGKGSSRSLNLL